ncbi:hypothetical protein M501DRAFT_1020942 [Patellaria atrata CBS 101060]|uniref:Uncharacterized protein n=1 Tax=Patellaria atrata CBS 101060 TaxID=1346257 RepID=A0A9P4S2U9_9PEZI|nr:hypothetical protein M501DRAFT_1020942 [Patellaria atrata CBS 101060]
MDQEIEVNAFNNSKVAPINQVLEASLVIGGRRWPTPIIVTDTGHNNILIGKEWFSKTSGLPDCRHHRIVWPEWATAVEDQQRDIVIPKSELRTQTDPQHQFDMERRDKAIDERERNRQKALVNQRRKPQLFQWKQPSSWAKNVGSDLRKMKSELSDLTERETPELSEKPKPKPSKRERKA